MTLEEINDFIKEKWKSPCDRCGRYDWTFVGSDADVLRGAISVFVEKDKNSPRPVSFVPYYCTNCGNLKMLHVSVLDEWLKNRKTT